MRSVARTAALLAALTLTACGSSESPAPQPNTTTVAEAPDAAIGHRFTPDPTIVNPHSVPIDSWTRLSDNTIAVNFQTGNPECFGVDATVTESPTTITVTLRGGTRADATGKMCTMNLIFGTMELPLNSPLGTRQILGTE
ncbi:hypothetical protein ACFXK0_24315 [Nocardia sp. NPDC059177]|uniref:hypothetical protein n=1 Tax=Nocardia sp. NPDC059177 TaxID=3346759 RepID=UPI0036B79AB6